MDVGEVMSQSPSSRQTRIMLLNVEWHSFDAQMRAKLFVCTRSMRSRLSHNTQQSKGRGAAMLNAIEI